MTLFAKVDGKKKFQGVLVSFNETEFVVKETIKGKENEIAFKREQVAHIVPVIKF